MDWWPLGIGGRDNDNTKNKNKNKNKNFCEYSTLKRSI